MALRRERRAASAVYGRPAAATIDAVRIVDMAESNSWAEFASLFCRTHGPFLEHEKSKAELKRLMPEDAKEAFGHGIRARRSKSGAVSFALTDWSIAMRSSSEFYRRDCRGPCKRANRTDQPRKVARCFSPVWSPRRKGPKFLICTAGKRTRHCAQVPRQA